MTQTYDDRAGGHGAQGDVEEFSRILGAYNYDIAIQGRLGLFSAHKTAEDVCMRLLNALYGWSLENRNEPGHKEEAVDLVDDVNRIVVQVTATCSRDKINHTLDSERTAKYHADGYHLKFAFVGHQSEAIKVQGFGKDAWTLHDAYGSLFFDRHYDTLFSANMATQFEGMDPASRMRILDLVRADIGVVGFTQSSECTTCIGYGPRQGKCRNDALGSDIPYCEECYAERFVDSVGEIINLWPYKVFIRIDNIIFLEEVLPAHTFMTPRRIVVIAYAQPRNTLSKLELRGLIGDIEDLESEYETADKLLVLDDAQGIDQDAVELASRKRVAIRYKRELERSVLDLTPYERYIEDCYSKGHMEDHVKLRTRHSAEMLNDVVYEFLSMPVSEDDDGSSRCRLLLGDFGVGKTSFCFSLAHDMIGEAPDDGGKAHGYYPIVLRLRDLNNDRSLDKLITSEFVDAYHVKGFTLETFKHYLSNNRVLMLFDGFDEITKRLTPDAKYDVYKAICSYAIGDTKIIVTCRPNFFQTTEEMQRLFRETPMHFEPSADPSLSFEEVVIDEFDDDQIREYLRYKEDQLAVAGLDADGFLHEIKEIHDLSDLARRPVLLEMILSTLTDILETRRDNASSKKRISAASLYKRYTSKWIEREIMKGRRLFSKEHKADFCTFMAFKMFSDGVSSVPVRDINNRIRHEYQVLAPEHIEEHANEIRSGSFFISNGDGTFGFVHRSFMEYFVAKELVRMLSDANCILEQCLGTQPFSTEIGRFAADIVRDDLDDLPRESVRAIWDRLRESSAGRSRDLRYNSALLLSKIGEGAFLLSGSQEDFKGFDLANIELENITIEGRDFSSANLSRARMSGVTFVDCSFVSTDLTEATFSNCRFEDLDADGSRWTGSTVADTAFKGVSLADANFSKALVTGCRFELADVSGMEVSDSTFAMEQFGDGVYGIETVFYTSQNASRQD